MSERTFDRETLLDITVNIVPLAIMFTFIVVFFLVTPWEPNLFMEAISMGLLVIPFILLALLTFISGRAIAEAEEVPSSAPAIKGSSDAADTEASDTGPSVAETKGTDEATSTDADETTDTGSSKDDAKADEI